VTDKPHLLFLHGVGTGDPTDAWKPALDAALRQIGYPGLDGVPVIAPKYPNSLVTSDDTHPLPGVTVREPSGERARQNRRDFDRRESAIETLLERHDKGADWLLGEPLTDFALKLSVFKQAANYLKKPQVRANVLTRVLSEVPTSGRLVIVGHSLGSVVAADLVSRLPADIAVVGMVTIGSPLSSTTFHAEGLRETLRQPPTNLAWWVSFWNPLDPVTTHKGVSSAFPWMTDYQVTTPANARVHDAVTYLRDSLVARAIGYALHGSQSRDIVMMDKGLDVPVDAPETLMLLALRYAYLTNIKLNETRRERYASARREVQGEAIEALTARRQTDNRPLPRAIAALTVDLSVPDSQPPEPGRVSHVPKEDAVLPLIGIMTANVIQPFEIDIGDNIRREALEDLTIEMGLGRQYARDLIEAEEAAHKALSGSTNWIKWAAIGVGAAALVAATGGLALAAAPGVAGAAAVTSALAAFGPGGMIGGLLTAGALVGAGGGGVALGLASPATTAEAVEAFVSTQLTAAILRQKQGLDQDPNTWANLAQTGKELRREQAHLEAISDPSAPSLKELKRKLRAVDRAVAYLTSVGLGPEEPDAPDLRVAASELFDRAADAFRSVDIDGDGIPDRPRARTAMDEAGSAIKDVAADAKGAVASLLRRKKGDQDGAVDGNAAPTADH